MSKKNLFIFLILLLAIALRLFKLDTIPPSLYTDEANQGYNAYSILRTGRDEHGAFLPVSLRSFGDWKPAIPTYLMIPFFALGFSPEYSIRLPGALLGIITVFLTYRIVLELFADIKYKYKVGLLAAFFLAISPWHILQSRAAMLVAVALFFYICGFWGWLKARQKGQYMVLSLLSFGISLYAYYGMRVIVPLTLLFLFWHSFQSIKKNFTFLVAGGTCFIIVLLPLGVSFLKEPDVVFGRAKTVSVFYDEGVKLRQWELITQDGFQADTTVTRFFHNEWFLYSRDIFRRFFSHFDGNFLFLTGDTARPFQIPHMGILNFADGLLVLIGVTALVFYFPKQKRILLFWLFVSLIPASLTFMTPSSNRTFNAVVPFAMLTALGIISVCNRHSERSSLTRVVEESSTSSYVYSLVKRSLHAPLGLVGMTSVYILSFFFFLQQYFLVLPKQYAQWWNWGWKDVAGYVQSVEQAYDSVVVMSTNGMPYIYFLLYGGIDPSSYQENAVRTYVPDRFGFEHVEGFEKYLFPTDWEWKYVKDNLQPKTLYVVPDEQVSDVQNAQKMIYYPNGEVMAAIVEND